MCLSCSRSSKPRCFHCWVLKYKIYRFLKIYLTIKIGAEQHLQFLFLFHILLVSHLLRPTNLSDILPTYTLPTGQLGLEQRLHLAGRVPGDGERICQKKANVPGIANKFGLCKNQIAGAKTIQVLTVWIYRATRCHLESGANVAFYIAHFN